MLSHTGAADSPYVGRVPGKQRHMGTGEQQGTQGIHGYRGTTGDKRIHGYRGTTGDTGDTWVQGIHGYRGYMGTGGSFHYDIVWERASHLQITMHLLIFVCLWVDVTLTAYYVNNLNGLRNMLS